MDYQSFGRIHRSKGAKIKQAWPIILVFGVGMWLGLIKSKETALETSTNTFLEKEKELLNKIKKLEKKVEEFNQSSALQKVVEDTSDEAGSTVEHLNGTLCGYEENGATMSSSKSEASFLKEEPTTLMNGKGEDNLCKILIKLVSVKEKNKEMESKLNEM